MNSTMGEEYNIQHLVIHVAAGITFTAGLMINGFIVAVIVTDWRKGRPMTSTDQILTSLGATRVFYQSACLLEIILHLFFKDYPIILYIILECLFSIFISSGNWLSNLLSVVFCLKISNFHNDLFLRLKIIILRRVVRLIISSLLVPICLVLIYFFIGEIEVPQNLYNKTYNREISETKQYIYLLWIIVPFLMCFMSTVLLIFSLCHHMNRMRCDSTVTGQLDIYYKTIKFSFFSFFSYAFYFVTSVTLWFHQGSLDDVGALFLFNIFPTLHSTYLIYVTARLRNRFSVIFRYGINCRLHRQGC